MDQSAESRFGELRENMKRVEDRVRAACQRAGRERSELLLLPVSKKKPLSDILLLYRLGFHAFGENYVQELCDKFDLVHEAARRETEAGEEKERCRELLSALPSDARPVFHMIGHLQKNKVKYLTARVPLIHSVDSLALAEKISVEAGKQGREMEILLEVNAAGEESKFGFSRAELSEKAGKIGELPHLRLTGLMTSAPYTEEPEENRRYFREMREMLLRLKEEYSGFPLKELSMGMSGDYETAIEEGATIVRIGTAIFGERDYTKQGQTSGQHR